MEGMRNAAAPSGDIEGAHLARARRRGTWPSLWRVALDGSGAIPSPAIWGALFAARPFSSGNWVDETMGIVRTPGLTYP